MNSGRLHETYIMKEEMKAIRKPLILPVIMIFIKISLMKFVIIGRMFVTMLGYPPKCERKGLTHSCTLSFACWLVGGSSEPGCGANPWIVACCVIAKKSLDQNHDSQKEE